MATGELSIFGISKLGMASKVLYNAAKESGHFAQAGERLLEEYGTVCNKLEQLEVKCAQALNKAKTEAEAVGTGGKAAVEAMEAEQAFGKKVAKAGESKIKNVVKQLSKDELAFRELLNDIPVICAKLDPSIGNIKIIEKALEAFKDTPGAIGTDGPISRVLRLGQKGGKAGQLSRAKGSVYELEAALRLEKNGEEVIGFGQKFGAFEFDIVTKNKLIECKNVHWSKLNVEDLNGYQRIFSAQVKTAKDIGMIFEVHSKQPLSQVMKEWIVNERILYFEG